MSIYNGSQKLKDIYIGGTKIKEIYDGSTLVYKNIIGIPLYAYIYTYSGGSLVLYTTEISTNGYVVYEDRGTINSFSASIGTTGSTISVGSPNAMIYTYSSKLTINNTILYIYKLGDGEVGILDTAIVGTHPLTPQNSKFSNTHPVQISSTSITAYIGIGTATVTATMDSSYDYLYTGLIQ